MAKKNLKRLESFDDIPGMVFHQLAYSGETGASVAGVEITGDPESSCVIVGGRFAPTIQDPGDEAGWFAGPGQDPPCASVVLNFNRPLKAFGVSFMHFSGAGIDATKPGTLALFEDLNGQGEKIAEVHSKGGIDVIDFVGLACRPGRIRSAVICSVGGTADFAADGYGILPRGSNTD